MKSVVLGGQAHTPLTHVCEERHSLSLEQDSPLRPGNIAYIYIYISIYIYIYMIYDYIYIYIHIYACIQVAIVAWVARRRGGGWKVKGQGQGQRSHDKVNHLIIITLCT